MRIAQLTLYRLRLPLRKEIRHASHTRRESDNVLVACRLADQTLGWGEGVPRSYVTGETVDGAIRQLYRSGLDEQLGRECQRWHDVIALVDSIRLVEIGDDPRGCLGNAARCAVELSILDAFGRHFGEPVKRVTAAFGPAEKILADLPSVRYSGAVTAASPAAERWTAVKMRGYGFRHCKIKVGLLDDEASRLRRLRHWLGRRMVIRTDANEAWTPKQALDQMRSMLPYRVACVEQPVPHADVSALAELRRQVPLPVMLDESLTSIVDAERAIRQGTCDLFNIRLSKCGGFLNSLRLAALADRAGIAYQLGCHPGESGVLSAAGRQWLSSVRGVRFAEGSYDRHLLRRLLTREDITFGYGGRAPTLPGPGLGVTIDPAALPALAQKCHEITIA